MPDLSVLLASLKSPRTAFVVFLFAAACLFAPFDRWGIKRPAFTTEYESFFVVILFLSAAILVVEILLKAWRFAKRPYYARKRKQMVEEVFLSLNLNEVCVLWAMTQCRVKVIKGAYSNPVMISLREKGCLSVIPGPQSLSETHHSMPDDIFAIVMERGYERMPDNFKNSVHFDDEIQEIVNKSTTWRSW